jgi:hypothetical protein
MCDRQQQSLTWCHVQFVALVHHHRQPEERFAAPDLYTYGATVCWDLRPMEVASAGDNSTRGRLVIILQSIGCQDGEQRMQSMQTPTKSRSSEGQ